MSQNYNSGSKMTLSELKLAKILSSSILQRLLKNKEITLETEVVLEKVQNIMKNTTRELVELINNNGRVPGKITKIPTGETDIIQQFNSALNIMNTELHKGTGSELIASPDFTPTINKGRGR